MFELASTSSARQSVMPAAGLADRADEAAAPRAHRFLTRQPVLDAGSRIVGYELSLRGNTPLPVLPGASDAVSVEDEYLLTSVADLEAHQALGSRLLLLSLSAATLFNPLLETVARERTLLALRAAELTPDAYERIAELAEAGYIFLLDDFSDDPQQARQLRLFEYARLDVTRYDALTLAHLALHARRTGELRLIAGHVESEEMLHVCRQLPFHLFQGHHFTHLQPAAPHRLDSDRMRVMDLLNMVMNHADLPKIEAAFKQDAALALRLLRYMNSPALGLRHEIQSIGHALVMLGHDKLYRWLTFLLFSNEQSDGRSHALFRTGLIRARLMETLGETRLTAGERGGLFLVGILSILDAVLNVPMAQALANLRLPQAIVCALQTGTGPYAPYLALVRACERFDQDGLARRAAELDMSADEVNLAHVNALIWSESLDL